MMSPMTSREQTNTIITTSVIIPPIKAQPLYRPGRSGPLPFLLKRPRGKLEACNNIRGFCLTVQEGGPGGVSIPRFELPTCIFVLLLPCPRPYLSRTGCPICFPCLCKHRSYCFSNPQVLVLPKLLLSSYALLCFWPPNN